MRMLNRMFQNIGKGGFSNYTSTLACDYTVLYSALACGRAPLERVVAQYVCMRMLDRMFQNCTGKGRPQVLALIITLASSGRPCLRKSSSTET